MQIAEDKSALKNSRAKVDVSIFAIGRPKHLHKTLRNHAGVVPATRCGAKEVCIDLANENQG